MAHAADSNDGDMLEQLANQAREEVRNLLARIMQEELRKLTTGPRPAMLRAATEAASAQREASLTNREVEVLALIARGYTNPQIAADLHLSAETVKTHVRHIMEKLIAFHRTEAAVKAVQLGLVTLPEETAQAGS